MAKIIIVASENCDSEPKLWKREDTLIAIADSPDDDQPALNRLRK